MLPGSGVKLCVGRCGDAARDAEQGTEGVERIENRLLKRKVNSLR